MNTTNIYISVLFLFVACLPLHAEKPRQEEGWTHSGELNYSYQYARTYLGHKIRLKGWVCKLSFTSGRMNEIEHSVWEKDGKNLQMMIWRIDANHTGYSWGEFTDNIKQTK